MIRYQKRSMPYHTSELWTSHTKEECLDQILHHYPESQEIMAHLNVYRVDQLILSARRHYNPEERLEEGYHIRYADGRMTPKDIQDFLEKRNLPRLESYINPVRIEPEI